MESLICKYMCIFIVIYLYVYFDRMDVNNMFFEYVVLKQIKVITVVLEDFN